MWANGCCDYHSDNNLRLVHIPDMHSDQLEGLAADILASTGLRTPVNALLLADALRLRLVPVGPFDEGRSGDEIRVNYRAPYRDRQEFISGCCARWAIMRHGQHASEVTARRLARALMLPRAEFLADLGMHRDLPWLLQRHRHASHTMICARLGDVGVKLRAIRRASSRASDESAVVRTQEREATAQHPRQLVFDSPLPQTR